MDFARVLTAVAGGLAAAGIEHALIGAFAMAALGVPRATADVDFLADGDRSDEIDRIMTNLGYQALHRSPDTANYASSSPALGHVDFLFARRTHSRAMLSRAKPRASLRGLPDLKVLEPEDIIGLKVQSAANNSDRAALDMDDIRRLLASRPDLDLGRVREYFRIFDREAELERILAAVRR